MAVVGTLSEALDNLYTTTWQQMKGTVRDQIFDSTPFWFWMKDKGKLKTAEGGRFLTEPLQYAKNDNVSWVTKGGTVKLNDFEHLTIAQYNWRYLVGSIVRFGVDDQQNRGKHKIISLMQSKLDNTQNSLISEMETQLFGGAGASDASIDGLQNLVADDPTAAANVGAIAQGTYSWWRNQTKDLSGKSFATDGISAMRTILNSAGNNLKMDFPDIIVSGQTPFEWYEDVNLGYYQILSNKLADAGFMSQQFKGIPMVWSPSCANTRMYFLNTNFIFFQYDPMMNFDMTEWKPIPDQVNDRAAQIVLAGAMTVSRRRCQAVIFGLDTA